MATQQPAPTFVSLDLWDEVKDMTEVFRKIQQEGSGRNRATRKKNRRAIVTTVPIQVQSDMSSAEKWTALEVRLLQSSLNLRSTLVFTAKNLQDCPD
jgi:hypothetical protein